LAYGQCPSMLLWPHEQAKPTRNITQVPCSNSTSYLRTYIDPSRLCVAKDKLESSRDASHNLGKSLSLRKGATRVRLPRKGPRDFRTSFFVPCKLGMVSQPERTIMCLIALSHAKLTKESGFFYTRTTQLYAL